MTTFISASKDRAVDADSEEAAVGAIKMSRRNLKKNLSSATCLLLGSVPVAQAGELESWDIDTSILHYQEADGRVQLEMRSKDGVEIFVMHEGVAKPLMVRDNIGIARKARVTARLVDAGHIETCDCDGDGQQNETVTSSRLMTC